MVQDLMRIVGATVSQSLIKKEVKEKEKKKKLLFK